MGRRTDSRRSRPWPRLLLVLLPPGARPASRLFSLLEQIRPKQPYCDLASDLAAELGPFNAAHIRRTDHLAGVPDYRRVTPWLIRDNLAAVFPADERLVVCTEADAESDVFKPLRAHFGDVVFLSPFVLDDPHRVSGSLRWSVTMTPHSP